MLIVLKSGSLNLLEPLGSVQACSEIAFIPDIMSGLWIIVNSISNS